MILLSRGRYTARQVDTPDDLDRARTLRTLAFGLDHHDVDPFDDLCHHVLIQEGDTVVACFRIRPMPSQDVTRSYTGQYYDLSALADYGATLLELGRFCLHPDHHSGMLVRFAWHAIGYYVRTCRAGMLFGCASFPGTSPDPYLDGFRLLRRDHMPPAAHAPAVKASETFAFGRDLAGQDPGAAALREIPSLLRSYLVMGGWVSDHAVIDHDMNTLHVFIGLEMSRMTETRRQAMQFV